MLLIYRGGIENMQNYINLLENIGIFKGFSIEDLENIFTKDLYKIYEYKKNSIIYFQNEKCTTLDIVLSGSVVVQKIDANGNVLTISEFIVGDALGGNLLFSKRNFYPMTVVAKTDTTVLHIKNQLILQLCQRDINFLKEFLQLISDKTLILTDRIKALTMKTIRQSIIEFLLYEYYAQDSTTIKLEMSKKELAEKLGVQRPSLSREFNKMRQDGLIEYDAKSIIIKDIDLLNQFHIDT